MLVEIDRVRLRPCNEIFYVDRVGAFNFDRGKFRVAHGHVVALADFITFDPVLAVDDRASFRIHILLFEPVSGRAVQKVEGDLLPVAGGGG